MSKEKIKLSKLEKQEKKLNEFSCDLQTFFSDIVAVVATTMFDDGTWEVCEALKVTEKEMFKLVREQKANLAKIKAFEKKFAELKLDAPTLKTVKK